MMEMIDTDKIMDVLYEAKGVIDLVYNGKRQTSSEYDNIGCIIHLVRCQQVLLERGIELVRITAKRTKNSPVNKYIVTCTNI